MAETQKELSLQLEEVRPLGIHIRSLGLQDLVQTLGLERSSGDCKVHKGHTGTEVRWKFNLERKLMICNLMENGLRDQV